MKSRLALVFGLIVLLVCALRFAVFADFYAHDRELIVDPDSKSYIDSAEAIYAHGRFDNQYGAPESWRTPGYPVFLAGLRAVFPDDHLFAAVVVQHAAFFLIVLVAAYLSFRLGGRAASVITATLLLTDFTFFYFVNEVLTETIYTLLMTVAVLLVYFASATERYRREWLFAAGLTISLATFVRPSSIYLIYVLVPALAWHFRSAHGDGRAALRLAGVVLIPWVLMLGAWYVRNYLTVGVFAFATIEDEVLFHRALYMVATMQKTDLMGARAWIAENLSSGSPSRLELVSFFWAHPAAYLRELVLAIGQTLLSPGQWYLYEYWLGIFGNLFAIQPLLFSGNWRAIATELATRPPVYLPIVIAVFAHGAIMSAGAFAALFFMRGLSLPRRGLVVAAFVYIGYFLFLVAMFHGSSRYRLPFTPVLAVLAGYGLASLWAWRRARSAEAR